MSCYAVNLYTYCMCNTARVLQSKTEKYAKSKKKCWYFNYEITL